MKEPNDLGFVSGRKKTLAEKKEITKKRSQKRDHKKEITKKISLSVPLGVVAGVLIATLGGPWIAVGAVFIVFIIGIGCRYVLDDWWAGRQHK